MGEGEGNGKVLKEMEDVVELILSYGKSQCLGMDIALVEPWRSL